MGKRGRKPGSMPEEEKDKRWPNRKKKGITPQSQEQKEKKKEQMESESTNYVQISGKFDLSDLIGKIKTNTPGPARMEVLVVPQEDGQAIWDITNDLATMNLHLKRNNEILVQIEKHLAALAEALEKK